MTTPTLRSLVGNQRAKVGTFLFEFATPGIGQILKAAGADYAVLDMEHTGFGFDTVRQVAIDEDWSALRFRRAEYIRSSGKGAARG